MKGVLSYILVNTEGANCTMSHTSAVKGNVNSYRNAPDNLNCMRLTDLTTENSLTVSQLTPLNKGRYWSRSNLKEDFGNQVLGSTALGVGLMKTK